MRPALKTVRAVISALLVARVSGCYVTHDYREIEEAPDLEAALPLAVRLEVVAGEVRLRRAERGKRYRLRLKYCRRHFAPLVTRDASVTGNTLSVKLRRRPRAGERASISDERNVIDLGLSRTPVVDLALDLGAGRHRADLGGLALKTLDLTSGSGEVTLAFDEPLSLDLERFEVAAGTGGVRLHRLGNASPERLLLSAGEGVFEIDLGGDWRRDATIDLEVRLGDVILTAPRGLGLEIRAAGRDSTGLILPEFSADGRGNYRSQTYDDASRRITVVVRGGLGILEARLGS